MTNIMINDVSDVHVSQGDVNDEVEIRLYDDNLIKVRPEPASSTACCR